MYQEATTGFRYYMRFYCQYVGDKWAEMGPAGYTTILVLIVLFGWLLLKSGMKK